MYLPTVRGETRIPSFISNSLAIRCSPHPQFSEAILRISVQWHYFKEGEIRKG